MMDFGIFASLSNLLFFKETKYSIFLFNYNADIIHPIHASLFLKGSWVFGQSMGTQMGEPKNRPNAETRPNAYARIRYNFHQIRTFIKVRVAFFCWLQIL